MTNQEIARALQDLIREDGKRPPEEQIRDLIEAGIIDKQGRVLIGDGKLAAQARQPTLKNGQVSKHFDRKHKGG